MNQYRTTSLAVLAVLLLGMIAGFATAQTPYSPPGGSGAPAPTPGPTTTGPVFGMNATAAVVVGLVLLLVILLVIVAVSKNDTTVTRPY